MLKTSEVLENRGAFTPKSLEFPLSRGAFLFLKGGIGETKRSGFSGNDPAIVDHFSLPERCNLLLHPGCLRAGKFRNGFNINVAGVEKQSAVRGIGADLGMIVEQRMERIERDARGSQVTREINQAG